MAKKVSVHEIVGRVPLQKARLDSGPLAVVADDDDLVRRGAPRLQQLGALGVHKSFICIRIQKRSWAMAGIN